MILALFKYNRVIFRGPLKMLFRLTPKEMSRAFIRVSLEKGAEDFSEKSVRVIVSRGKWWKKEISIPEKFTSVRSDLFAVFLMICANFSLNRKGEKSRKRNAIRIIASVIPVILSVFFIIP